MANSLRGQGKDPAVTRFDRTHVRQVGPGRVTVIPLDQIDHIRSGKADGHVGFLALGAVAAIAGAIGAIYGSEFVRIGGLVAGVLLAGAGFAAFMLVRPPLMRISSNAGQITQGYATPAAQHVRLFIEELLQARTTYLEGVYEEGPEAEGPLDAPAEPGPAEELEAPPEGGA